MIQIVVFCALQGGLRMVYMVTHQGSCARKEEADAEPSSVSKNPS